MGRNTNRPEQDPIEKQLLDDGETGEQNIVEAATEAFQRDQRDPDHPTRTKRSSGVEDPSHSRGSTREGAGRHDI